MRKKVVIMILIVIFTVYFLDKATPDGWLSFFGSIIAVGGVYYQVHRDIENERELQFSLKRPYIVFARRDAYLNEKIFMSEKLYSVENSYCSIVEILTATRKISLKNLSDNLLMSVKIIINYPSGYKEIIMVDRIDGNTAFSFVPGNDRIIQLDTNIKDLIRLIGSRENADTKRKLEDLIDNFQVEDTELNKLVSSIDSENMDDICLKIQQYLDSEANNFFIRSLSKIYAEIESIGIYFTTSVREKIYLEFKSEKEDEDEFVFEYDKSKTKIENKGDTINIDDYDTAKIVESPSVIINKNLSN